MSYNDFIESSQIPPEFDNNHHHFAQIIVNTLMYNIEQDFDDNNHPFHRYADDEHGRNEIINNIEEDTLINNMYGEQMLIDYFRSNSIYHNWLQNMLDYYIDYAVSLNYFE
jgi:hypothetical protein